MADLGRKDLGDKASEKLTPESQKSATDKVTEGVTNVYDKAASSVQPEGDKSVSQSLNDTVGGTSKPGEKGYVEQAQETLGSAATYVKDTANNLANQASDATKQNK